MLNFSALNALSSLIAENTVDLKKFLYNYLMGFWSSNNQIHREKPDIEAIDMTSRINSVNDIFEVTTKPMIFGHGYWWKTEHFEFNVRSQNHHETPV